MASTTIAKPVPVNPSLFERVKARLLRRELSDNARQRFEADQRIEIERLEGEIARLKDEVEALRHDRKG
jgi:hypothetical protein